MRRQIWPFFTLDGRITPFLTTLALFMRACAMPVSIACINVKFAKFVVLSQRVLNLLAYLESEFVIGFGCQGKSAVAPQGSKESLQAKVQFEKRRVMLEKSTT